MDPQEEHKDELWMPIAVGSLALLAGLGLAYIVNRPPKTVHQITREETVRLLKGRNYNGRNT